MEAYVGVPDVADKGSSMTVGSDVTLPPQVTISAEQGPGVFVNEGYDDKERGNKQADERERHMREMRAGLYPLQARVPGTVQDCPASHLGD